MLETIEQTYFFNNIGKILFRYKSIEDMQDRG